MAINGNENKEFVICPTCRSKVIKIKFCTECGFPLSGQCESVPSDQSGTGPVIQQPIQNLTSEDSKPFDDSGLTLLGDFCKKSMATVGGDGYDEIVLYRSEADGSYQIHTFMKYEYMPKEIHHSYKAKDGAYEALLELVDELQLDEYEGKTGVGLCGGMYICKYSKNGTIHRVTTDNMGMNGPALLARVNKLLGSFAGEEITE